MSTNANIMILNKDNSIDKIYNHWDGDIDYLGSTLYKYYQDESKVRKLINLGDVSHTGALVESSPLIKRFGFDWFSNKELKRTLGEHHYGNDKQTSDDIYNILMEMNDKYTIAYHRDRDEDKVKTHYNSIEDIFPEEYNYVYDTHNNKPNNWICCHMGIDSQDQTFKHYPNSNWSYLGMLLRMHQEQ